MEKKDIINIILGISEDSNLKSTLQIALKQARRLIGYDSTKGGTSHGNMLFRENGYTLDLSDEQKVEFYGSSLI